MRRYAFNGEPILTNDYRADRKKYGNNLHFGEDYAMPRRTAIVAVADGKIKESVYWLNIELPQDKRQWLANTRTDPYKPKFGSRSLRLEDYGNRVIIDHGKGVNTLYAHLDEVLITKGSVVKEGQVIGYSDSTGNSSGNHLHFEIRRNNRVVDPNTFDYKFNGEGGEEQKYYPLSSELIVTVSKGITLNVRKDTSKLAKISWIAKSNQKITVVGCQEGEPVENNPYWWKLKSGEYAWTGGTVEGFDPKTYGDGVGKSNPMSKEEFEAKKADLEAKIKASEEATEALRLELAELPVPVEEAQPVEETPVEVVAEEVKAPEESEEVKAKMAELTELESKVVALKAELGL